MPYNNQATIKDPIMGAVIGDISGSTREGLRRSVFNTKIKLFPAKSRITDDTVLTMAIAEWLSNKDTTTARGSLYRWGTLYPHAGYGGGFKNVFLKSGESYNSTHNGGAMRVSPVALKAESVEECINLAEESAAPTHDTTEGTNGACAIALSVYLALHSSTKEEIREEIEKRYGYDLSKKVEHYRSINIGIRDGVLPKTESIAAANATVPLAITAFLESEDFESAVKGALSAGGDSDTNASMAGAIAAAFYGIPEDIVDQALVYLPAEMIHIINALEGTEYKPTGITPPTAQRWTRKEYLVYGSDMAGTVFEKAHDLCATSRFNKYPMKGYAIHAVGSDLETIRQEVNDLIIEARSYSDKRFHVSEIGCEKGGYSPSDIAPLFKDARKVGNILLPESFVNLIG